jgi:enediyne biosynthesis protein E5
VTDPATTPSGTSAQVIFGGAAAFTCGLFMVLHIVFDLFFGLSIVCAGCGLAMAIQGLKPKQRTPHPTRCAL